MATNENTFADEARKLALHEVDQGDDYVALMLQHEGANKINTPRMAKLAAAAEWISEGWEGPYQNLLAGLADNAETRLMTLGGAAREQAIKIKGEGTREENQKRGGIFNFKMGGGAKEA